VILLSARSGEEAQAEGLEAGADDYLIKPFNARELLARVSAHLQMARLRREADQAKDEFLAMLGHELRNPLQALGSAVALLGVVDAGPAASGGARAVIERQVTLLTRLVDDLLDMSRVTTRKITLDRRPLDLGAFVESIVGTWRAARRLASHHVSLVPASVWVAADPARLEQIVSNLLGNALKFTPAGGRITVRVAVDGGEAVFEVEDTGVGIPAGLIDRVFDLFVQADRPPDRAQGGLGIGLTLARHPVTLHGGTLAVESEGSGKGSRFTVRLPAVVPTPVAQTAEAPLPKGTARRILIVEDHDDAREMLQMILGRDGHEVYDAADGESGLATALKVQPDVAFIDVGLPGLDGYEVARRIRAHPDGKRMYLVALTGYGQPDDRRRAEAAGFNEHLVKPIDPTQLAPVIARAD
jgi:signal transduction histidine kinase